jgi:TRAP-type C4-dicarboxylate transport system permease small subunit
MTESDRQSMMRRALDLFFDGCGLAAVTGLVAICAIMLIQVAGREVGIQVPGADDLVAFSTAASAFLGAAHTLRRGDFIRMGVIIESLPARWRRVSEIYALAVALFLAGYFAYYAGRMVMESYQFNDKAQGLLPIPMWIPQLTMAIGILALALALAVDLYDVLRGETPSYERATAERIARGEFPGEGSI